MIVYYVHKEGAYGHGIIGMSLDLEGAKELAIKTAKKDVDTHHSYNVYEYDFSNPVATEDADPIFSCDKKGIFNQVYTDPNRYIEHFG